MATAAPFVLICGCMVHGGLWCERTLRGGGVDGGGGGQRAREASQVPETIFITAGPCKQAAIRGLIAATVAEGMDSFRY